MPEVTGVTPHSAAQDASDRRSPYVGLSFYREQDSEFFFGRDSEQQVIMGNLQASRLTLLYAESGVGKSSLLRAGVAARLAELARHQLSAGGSADVPVVFSAWKDDPVDDLIGEIERTVISFLGESADPLELPRDSLTDAINAAAKALDALASKKRDGDFDVEDGFGPRSTLLIILDQFEEYFLYGSRESWEGRLAEELATAVNRTDLNANFLISIREDAYSALGDLLRGRLSNVYGNYLHLEYLDDHSAREAVLYPIDRYNQLHPDEPRVSVEPGLVQAVLEEVRRPDDSEPSATDGAGPDGSPGGGQHATQQPAPSGDGRGGEIVTPALQLVMATLWDRERGEGSRVLRRSTLEELHGARQIIANHLETALSALDPDERDLAIDSLDHLVTPSGAKIALEVRDLAKWTRRPPEQVEDVLGRLTGDARVLRRIPPAPGKRGDDPANKRFEIYHDVLSHPIRQSVDARELRLARQRVARFRKIALGAVALAAVAVVGIIIAIVATLAENSAKHDAQSRQLAASAEQQLDSNPELAALLAIRAINISPTDLAQKALRESLPQLQLDRTLNVEPPVTKATFSPNGKLIVSSTADGVAHLWDAGSHKQVATLGLPGLSTLESVVFSQDGTRIATVYGDGTARLWNSSTHQQVGRVMTAPFGGALLSAAFSPNGRQLVTAGNDGAARVWDTRTATQLGECDEPSGTGVNGVAYSPDGRFIATSSIDGDVYIWSPASCNNTPYSAQPIGRPLINKDHNAMYSVAYSPDGRLLLTTAGDGIAEIWNPTTHARVGELDSGDANVMLNAVFSRDGKLIVTSGLDGRARIWNVPPLSSTPTTSRPTLVLPRNGSHGTSILSAAFDSSGRLVVTAGADGTARIWDVPSGAQRAVLNSKGADVVTSAAVSPDGRSVATGTRDGTVSIWNSSSGIPTLHLQLPHQTGVDRVAFSGHGYYLIVAGDNGYAYVIDPTAGWFVSEIPSTSDSSFLTSAQFDPAVNRLLMTAAQGDVDNRSTIRFWTLNGNGAPRQNGPTLKEPKQGQINDARFSPDGKYFVTADQSGNAYIWDAATRKPIGAPIIEPPNPHANTTINSVAFSHDGSAIVTASDDGTARIWDAVHPSHQLLATITAPYQDSLLDAEFTASDSAVVTSGRDGAVSVWDLASGRQLLALMGHTAAVHGIAVSNDGRLILSASNDGTARIWDALPVAQQGPSITEPARPDLNTISFSPDGRLIAAAQHDGTIRLWSATGAHRQAGVLQDPGSPNVDSAEFNRNGTLLASSDDKGATVVWDVQRRAKLFSLTKAADRPLTSALFSPAGNLIVTSGQNGARLWDVSKRKSIRLLDCQTKSCANGNPLRWAAFSADGSLVVTAEADGAAKAWDVSTGAQRFANLIEPGGEAMSSAWFSPTDIRINGHTYSRDQVVVTSSDDGTARIWDLATGSQLRAFTEPSRSSVYNAIFSRDGSKILTASQDGTVRLWSVATGQLLTTFYTGEPAPDAEFSPSGNQVAVANYYGQAHVFSTQLAGSIQTLIRYANQHLTRKLTSSELKQYASGS